MGEQAALALERNVMNEDKKRPVDSLLSSQMRCGIHALILRTRFLVSNLLQLDGPHINEAVRHGDEDEGIVVRQRQSQHRM